MPCQQCSRGVQVPFQSECGCAIKECFPVCNGSGDINPQCTNGVAVSLSSVISISLLAVHSQQAGPGLAARFEPR